MLGCRVWDVPVCCNYGCAGSTLGIYGPGNADGTSLCEGLLRVRRNVSKKVAIYRGCKRMMRVSVGKGCVGSCIPRVVSTGLVCRGVELFI